ncbi:hypothetical protein PENSPDRAFT_679563 [Peniophora sp. CONT]|nr:hypothetical protein PENSPDRAFT_679563 [Peniophora sp. CONT]
MPVKQDSSSLNFLAFLAHGLDEVNGPGRRKYSESSLAKADKLQARTLDSLAYILVGQESSQVVAVGALLPPKGSSETAITLVVSENDSVLDSTSSHLNHVLGLLRVIHDYPPTKAEDIRIEDFERKGEATDYVRQFITLETALIKYCAPKLDKRYRKDSRNTNFTDSLADLFGLPAHERDDLTQTQRDSLKAFQAAAHMVTRSDGRPWLQHGARASHSAARYLSQNLLSGDADVPERIRSALHSLHSAKKVLDQLKHLEFRIFWNAYIKNVLRWLSKATAICEHYGNVARIATTPSLASAFFSRGFKTKFLRNPMASRQVSFFVDRPTVRQVLSSVGVPLEHEDEQRINDFIVRLANSQTADITGDHQLEVTTHIPVHCECNVLKAIHSKPAVSYIGVSELSCAFCAIYFDAYREVTGERTYTRGTHDQTTDWACASLVEDDSRSGINLKDFLETDTRIRASVCKQLRGKIARGWNVYVASPRNSQSTSASEQSPGRSGNEEKADDDWENPDYAE